MKAALVTPFLCHLPLHPSSYIGYGAGVLGTKYEVDIIDFNSEVYFSNKDKLFKCLNDIDTNQVVSDIDSR